MSYIDTIETSAPEDIVQNEVQNDVDDILNARLIDIESELDLLQTTNLKNLNAKLNRLNEMVEHLCFYTGAFTKDASGKIVKNTPRKD